MNIIDPKIQYDIEKLFDELVPMSGKCETIAGECVRAASKLRYDFYNNGMGNNTSGPANFLMQTDAIDNETYRTIYEYTRGRIYNGRYLLDDALHKAIEKMTESVSAFVNANPQLRDTIYEVSDMFDFEDEEMSFCDYCGDESDNSYICETCEEEQEAEEVW